MTQLDLIEVTSAMRRELVRFTRTFGGHVSRPAASPALPAVALARRTPAVRTPAQA